MAESYANDVQTTLSGDITSTATSLTVASASGFPSSGQYRIRIDNEILLVTGGQGTTTWTVTREAEDASRFPKAAHTSGAAVYHVVTAGSLANLIIPKGTAFPTTNVATNDFFYRTDVLGGILCAYDGTRWVGPLMSDTNNAPEELMPIDVSGRATARWPLLVDYDIFIVDFRWWCIVTSDASGNGASHYWTPNFDKFDVDNNITAIGVGTSTASSAALKNINNKLTVNATVGTSNKVIRLSWIKTGTPGKLYAQCWMNYRLVIT